LPHPTISPPLMPPILHARFFSQIAPNRPLEPIPSCGSIRFVEVLMCTGLIDLVSACAPSPTWVWSAPCNSFFLLSTRYTGPENVFDVCSSSLPPSPPEVLLVRTSPSVEHSAMYGSFCPNGSFTTYTWSLRFALTYTSPCGPPCC